MLDIAKSYKNVIHFWPSLLSLGRQRSDYWDGKSPTPGS